MQLKAHATIGLTLGVLGRPKGDSWLFCFLAIQIACVCLASYRGHLSKSFFYEQAFCMQVACGYGNVHSRTSHTMIMMNNIIGLLIVNVGLL